MNVGTDGNPYGRLRLVGAIVRDRLHGQHDIDTDKSPVSDLWISVGIVATSAAVMAACWVVHRQPRPTTEQGWRRGIALLAALTLAASLLAVWAVGRAVGLA